MYEAKQIYSSEQGFEIRLLFKVGDYWAYSYGVGYPELEHISPIPSSSIHYCTESYLTHNGFHRGSIERFNCRCGYKSKTPFGVGCPSCGETMAFYGAKAAFEKLPPLEDILG